MSNLFFHGGLLVARFSLFLTCRAALPWLFSEARHASFEPPSSSTDEMELDLPSPATASSSRAGSARLFGSSPQRHQPKPSVGAAHVFATKVGFLGWTPTVSSLAAVLFAFSFEETATLFLLVFLDIASVMPTATTAIHLNWNVSLVASIVLAVGVLPFSLCLLFTFRTSRVASGSQAIVFSPRRLLPAVIPFLVWGILFFKVPLPQALTAPEATVGTLGGALAREAVLGVSIVALLAGSGAMSQLWDTYEAFSHSRRRPPTAADVRSAEAAYSRACSDLAARRSQLDAIRSGGGSFDDEGPAANGNLGGMFTRMWSGTKRSRETNSLTQEVTGLSTLAWAMRDDLDQMKRRHREDVWGRSLQGQVLLALGHIFSAYCAFRVVVCLFNLVLYSFRASPITGTGADTAAGGNNSADVISYTIARALRLFDVDLDVSVWTRVISLLLVGAIIIGRMRSVLAGVGSIFRAASSGVGSSALIIFLAEVLIVYLLATLIQLRSTLPVPGALPTPPAGGGEVPPLSPPSLKYEPLLATLPSFAVFGTLFDFAFLIAASVTFAVRFLASRGDDGVLASNHMRD